MTVRWKNVSDALYWLINNNPHYSNVQLKLPVLNTLPENGQLHDLPTVEVENNNSNSN